MRITIGQGKLQAMEYVALAEQNANGTIEEDPYFFKQKYTKEGNVINVDFNKK